MSGHSKWSTIKRQKGAADIKRGQVFTKVASAITIAVKLSGSGDPNSNPKLRIALEQAKEVNLPKDNIQRAIDRGLVPQRLGSAGLEEVTYEGFGPGKVAFYLEGVTDNRLRTLQEIKNIFERSGGSLGSPGSTAYNFEKVGEVRVRGKGGEKDEEMLELIDLGAKDVESFKSAQDKNIQEYLVYTERSELDTMGNKITQAGFEVESQELVMKPMNLQSITDPDLVKKVIEFTEKLEDMDDIQKVYANFDIAEELMQNI